MEFRDAKIIWDAIDSEKDAIREKMAYLNKTDHSPQRETRLTELQGKIDGLEIARVIVNDNVDRR